MFSAKCTTETTGLGETYTYDAQFFVQCEVYNKVTGLGATDTYV